MSHYCYHYFLYYNMISMILMIGLLLWDDTWCSVPLDDGHPKFTALKFQRCVATPNRSLLKVRSTCFFQCDFSSDAHLVISCHVSIFPLFRAWCFDHWSLSPQVWPTGVARSLSGQKHFWSAWCLGFLCFFDQTEGWMVCQMVQGEI